MFKKGQNLLFFQSRADFEHKGTTFQEALKRIYLFVTSIYHNLPFQEIMGRKVYIMTGWHIL